MHNQKTALLTIRILWNNYLLVDKQVRGEPAEPFDIRDLPDDAEKRVALWLCRQSFILGAWNVWEQYADAIRANLPATIPKKDESFPSWLDRSFKANHRTFAKADWFMNANGLRNLIVHSGARVRGNERSQRYWQQTQAAFPSVSHFLEDYVAIEGDHAAEVAVNIREFIELNPFPFPPINT